MNRRIALVLAAAAAVLVSGCQASQAGTPTSSNGGSASGQSHGAPKVTSPLDGSTLQANICTALTQQQVAALGYQTGPGTDKSDKVGPTCQWDDRNKLVGWGISMIPGNKNGLDDVYAQKEYQKYFEPTTVDGYPGLYGSEVDDRPNGICLLDVGINDSAIVEISVVGTEHLGKASCGLAEKLAADVIHNLQAGS